MKTPSLKKAAARKAAKTTVRHTAHGAASKLRREPMRTATLLGIGALTGLLVGLLLSRNGAAESQQAG